MLGSTIQWRRERPLEPRQTCSDEENALLVFAKKRTDGYAGEFDGVVDIDRYLRIVILFRVIPEIGPTLVSSVLNPIDNALHKTYRLENPGTGYPYIRNVTQFFLTHHHQILQIAPLHDVAFNKYH